MRGREEVRTWIWKTMETFPGSYMTPFPSLWSVIDEPTGRVICELDNPMRDPGDGTIISATNISIVTYAGDGQWCRQEDIYNPLRFVSATMKWCRKAEELGTLPDEAAAWMKQFGAGNDRQLVIGANGYLGSHVTRQLVDDGAGRAGDGARRREHDRHRRPEDDAVRRRHLERRRAARGDGRLRRRLLLRRRHPRLAAGTRRRCSTPTSRAPATCSRSPSRRSPSLQRFVFTSSYVTVGRKRGRVATEDDVDRRRAGSPRTCGRGCRPRSSCCSTRASTACPRSRCACRPPTAAATGAAHRTARSSRARRSASCRS